MAASAPRLRSSCQDVCVYGIANENGIENSVRLSSKRTARFRVRISLSQKLLEPTNQPTNQSIFDVNHLLHVASVRRKKLWRSTVEKAFPNFTAHIEKAYATRETEVDLAAKPICEGRTGPLAESVSVARGHLWFHERYRASPCDNAERLRRA